MKIRLFDTTITTNDKAVTIKYNIPDVAIGLLLLTGYIGTRVYFSIIINHGTKWSAHEISFCASNSDTSSIVYDFVDKKSITFNANAKLSLDDGYKVVCLLIA